MPFVSIMKKIDQLLNEINQIKSIERVSLIIADCHDGIYTAEYMHIGKTVKKSFHREHELMDFLEQFRATIIIDDINDSDIIKPSYMPSVVVCNGTRKSRIRKHSNIPLTNQEREYLESKKKKKIIKSGHNEMVLKYDNPKVEELFKGQS